MRAAAVTANMEVDSGVETEVTGGSQSGGRDSVSAAPAADVAETVAVAMPKVGAHGSAFNGDNFLARTTDKHDGGAEAPTATGDADSSAGGTGTGGGGSPAVAVATGTGVITPPGADTSSDSQ